MLETSSLYIEEMNASYQGGERYLSLAQPHLCLNGLDPRRPYDMVIAMGNSFFPYWLCAYNRRRGLQTRLRRLCDGVVYQYSELNVHFQQLFCHVQNPEGVLRGGFEAEYIFNPGFGKLPQKKVFEIPSILPDSPAVGYMDEICAFSQLGWTQAPYIFLTSATIDGKNCYRNETQIISKVMKRVGPENLLVRPHPRRRLEDLKALGVRLNAAGPCSE